MTTRIVTVHIVDATRFLDMFLPPFSRDVTTMAFLRASKVFLPGKAHPMFPWSVCTELASFIDETWDGSELSIRFQIDENGNTPPVGQGVLLTTIARHIIRTNTDVDRCSNSFLNGDSPLPCEEIVICVYIAKRFVL